MNRKQYTAIYKKSGNWYLAWIEEIPGANTQGRTLREARDNLREALSLILETNHLVSLSSFGNNKVIREPLIA
ncbi:hypothetical protein A3I95_03135 [Candidatus Nomurabacteria bacterium RIFCSPLOWO2_02_FULL_44_12]|uniref:HicB-like antitoxin of toxin-antitoxin system domain-containing protein n=1 Tax=Candidatus Nomurabacteria bacterium RIFCSPLOWO2_12_FULL_44_11 TaxID=1801796 RepID=A0A1F6Y3P5_9BACT|nr:MAG: hypothetical protein A3E95_00090 [Candidatus Nomurabacteria bacterium RIFCSPHIGHO2_12_FULL_44_22b]OGJ00955.1 MAG: hypothetical protein A3G53_02815 [Candidatus Nomurabacteria bacterium RIFCSPLOWO2_12_FULL_44_11]OGJ08260.1 MAG: hypothetical protein A3I95_03135 [Candidatus Nomurabacteria bacterium RIFCSPLOWO2_02_FULL_44_12]